METIIEPIEVLNKLFELHQSNDLPKDFSFINVIEDIVLIKTDPKWETIKQDRTNEYHIGFIVNDSDDGLENITYKMDEIIEILANNDNEPMQECQFDEAWRGKCNKKSDEKFCDEHRNIKCHCGEQAIKTCPETYGLVCGSPLCENCTCECKTRIYY
jgi:hypothetical protein